MTTLFLVRHAAHLRQGQALVGRTSGIGLGETGRRQAHLLAERLAREDLSGVWASPLDRARETAEPIADRAGLTVELADELTEIDFGEWTGRDMAELSDDMRWHRWNMHRGGTRAPGGETMVEVQARVLRFVERLRGAQPDGRFVLVSHGDVIRAALVHFLGMPIDLLLRLEVDPGSLSLVEVEDWGPRVVRFNELP